jgi:hypothetical protein
METQMHNQEPDWQKCQEEWARSRRRGKVLGGIVLVGVGSLLLARHLGAELPEWLFSWKILLIVVGLFVGIKHSFRSWGWLIPIAVGTAFLIGDYYPEMHLSRLFWPIAIIVVGLAMIFRPRNRHHEYWRQRWQHKHRARWENYYKEHEGAVTNSDDMLETTSVFAGVRKNVISKDFKGGEVNCFFGGAVINLSQADINGKVVLEVNAVFGGAKLIVPQHWVIQSADLVSVMGGIDDKRPVQNVITNPDKILVLKGTAVFGGIEILN